MNNQANPLSPSNDEPQLIRTYIETLLENIGFIFRFVLISLLVGVFGLFIIPRVYTAKLVLMPPEDPNKQNSLTQAAAGALGLNSLATPNNAAEVLVELLKSNVIAESLIVQEGLEEVFLNDDQRIKTSRSEKREILIKELAEASKFLTNKTGYITIETKIATPFFSFSSTDDDSARARATRIANGYVSVLDKTNRRLANLKSLYNTQYFAEQITLAKQELDTVYALFEFFQKSNKAISLTEQMKLQLETISKIKAQMVAEELQLDLLLRDRQPTDMLVTESKIRLNEYKKKYEESLQGNSDKFSPGFDQMPAVTREYANYYREVKIQEEVYGLLKQLYFKERVQGYRNTPTVVVLDSAVAPFYRTSPKRGIGVLLIVVVSFFVAVFITLCRTWIDKVKNEQGYEKVYQLFSTIRTRLKLKTD